MEKKEFMSCRDGILEILAKYQVERWHAARVLSSAMNELLAPDGEQAVITLRPLLAYHEPDDKV